MNIFNERGVSFVIHAGDYVRPKAVKSFQGIKLIGVLGNNDVNVSGLTHAFNNIGGELKGDFCEIEQDGVRFAVYHGTKLQQKHSLIQSGNYDVVVCSHTHKLERMTVGQTTVLIPGTANCLFLDTRPLLLYLIHYLEPLNLSVYKKTDELKLIWLI